MDRNVGIYRTFLYRSCVVLLACLTLAAFAVTRLKVHAAEQQDTEPPTTTATLLGDWNGYYFTSSVEVSISATDAPSGQSQDIAYTAYRINSGNWTSYTEPFFIHLEGLYSISYFSEDDAGNPEPAKTTQLEINFNSPSPTPTPTQSVVVTSAPTPTSVPVPTTIPGSVVSPTVTPSKTPTPILQSYPASYPYYRSPTKTPTPTPTKVKIVTANKPIITTEGIIPSPTQTVQEVQEETSTNQNEPQNILGQWTKVKQDKPESGDSLVILILAFVILCAYIVFVFYSYSKMRN